MSAKVGYFVRSTIKGGAAERNGNVQEGDTILAIDGRRIHGKGGLGRILSSYRRGNTAQLTVRKLDGREVVISNFVMGGRKKDSRATLGVISGSRKAAAHNTKKAVAKATAARSAASTAKASGAVATPVAPAPVAKVDAKEEAKKVLQEAVGAPVDPFHARAQEEMADTMALLADMRSRDAYLNAKKLRSKLRGELQNGHSENLVNDYLERMRLSREAEEHVEEQPRRLSFLGRLVVGAASLATLSGIAGGVYYVLHNYYGF